MLRKRSLRGARCANSATEAVPFSAWCVLITLFVVAATRRLSGDAKRGCAKRVRGLPVPAIEFARSPARPRGGC